jgi:oxygen-independent coproporphyrinogen-3 oxidase
LGALIFSSLYRTALILVIRLEWIIDLHQLAEWAMVVVLAALIFTWLYHNETGCPGPTYHAFYANRGFEWRPRRQAMSSRVQFNSGLIEKYGMTGPRYTSYPTAVHFHEGFDEVAYRMFAEQSNEDFIPRPLSLYLHMPFCSSLCYFCGCNKKITRHQRHGVTYLVELDREIELQSQLFDRDREVIQLHFGGGTPTFFNDTQLTGTMRQLGRHFNLSKSEDREFSIEIDPRTVNTGRLANLGGMGFNRLSLGIQDFNPAVQKAVNRVQNRDETLELIKAAHGCGFDSVSVDLIYGLPLQTVKTFTPTVEAVLSARPERISVYNYAHMPSLFRAQRLIRAQDLPSPEQRLHLLENTIEQLTAEGYEYIGMDHFALPDDDLAKAARDGRLQRNFQGYSTCRECDLVGMGVSAISKVGNCYSQNLKDIRHWQSAVQAGHLPTWRGISLRREDQIRRRVIESIMCSGEVQFDSIEDRFDIDFTEFFAPEMEKLQVLDHDGLLVLDEESLEVTPAGRLLLRAIAMVFDEYLDTDGTGSGHSNRRDSKSGSTLLYNPVGFAN